MDISLLLKLFCLYQKTKIKGKKEGMSNFNFFIFVTPTILFSEKLIEIMAASIEIMATSIERRQFLELALAAPENFRQCTNT